MGVKGYGVEALHTIPGDSLSGFSSRSEQAIARALERMGLSFQWYVDKLQDQSGLCVCGKLEKIRLPNGNRKPLGIGLDENGRPSSLICSTCSARDRKSRSRGKVRDRKENAPKKFMSNENWWAQNKRQLTPAQIEEFQERENRVLDLEIMMTYYLNNLAEDVRTPLEKLIPQVERDVKAHGLRHHPDLNFHEFHGQIDFGDCKETYNEIMYGFSTAIEAQLYWDFIHKVKPNPAPRCMTHGCTNPQGKLEPWFCDGCSLERTRRSNAHHRGATPPGHEDRMYSVQGEWRTADTSKAAWFARLPGE